MAVDGGGAPAAERPQPADVPTPAVREPLIPSEGLTKDSPQELFYGTDGTLDYSWLYYEDRWWKPWFPKLNRV